MNKQGGIGALLGGYLFGSYVAGHGARNTARHMKQQRQAAEINYEVAEMMEAMKMAPTIRRLHHTRVPRILSAGVEMEDLPGLGDMGMPSIAPPGPRVLRGDEVPLGMDEGMIRIAAAMQKAAAAMGIKQAMGVPLPAASIAAIGNAVRGAAAPVAAAGPSLRQMASRLSPDIATPKPSLRQMANRLSPSVVGPAPQVAAPVVARVPPKPPVAAPAAGRVPPKPPKAQPAGAATTAPVKAVGVDKDPFAPSTATRPSISAPAANFDRQLDLEKHTISVQPAAKNRSLASVDAEMSRPNAPVTTADPFPNVAAPTAQPAAQVAATKPNAMGSKPVTRAPAPAQPAVQPPPPAVTAQAPLGPQVAAPAPLPTPPPPPPPAVAGPPRAAFAATPPEPARVLPPTAAATPTPPTVQPPQAANGQPNVAPPPTPAESNKKDGGPEKTLWQQYRTPAILAGAGYLGYKGLQGANQTAQTALGVLGSEPNMQTPYGSQMGAGAPYVNQYGGLVAG